MCLVLLGESRVRAQSWGPWMPVTDNCGCTAPTDNDPRCTAKITSCLRRDSVPVLTAGTPTTMYSNVGSCINCPSCCETGGCPDYTINCGETCSLTFTQTISRSVSGRITVKAPIESSLEGTVGWSGTTTLTVVSKCEVNHLAVCGRVFNQASLSYELDRMAYMYHEWQLTGTWVGRGCPIPAPATWTKSCGTDKSTVRVSLYTSDACTVLCADKCGPECDGF
jgi:hypothetical protein